MSSLAKPGNYYRDILDILELTVKSETGIKTVIRRVSMLRLLEPVKKAGIFERVGVVDK